MTGDFKQRIGALTPGQRSLLAAKLMVGPRPNRLLAYVKRRPGAAPLDLAALKEHLKERLPAHMIPSAIIELETIPRLPNGKIDREKLPKTVTTDVASPRTSAPLSRAQGILRQIWQEVLGLDEVSVDDDFFEVGGDSVLSIQIVSRARTAGLYLAPGDLADYPTIAGLASRAETVSTSPHEGGTRGAGSVIRLTPIQHWFFGLDLAKPEHWNQSFAIDLDPRIDDASLEKVVECLTEQHEQLRAGVHKENAEWVQEVTDPVGLHPLADPEAASLQTSFRFDGSPLVRFAIDRRLDRLRLIIVAHHLIVDLVSWQILIEDLTTACGCVLASRPIQLPGRTTSFASWAERIAEPDRDKLRAKLSAWEALDMELLGRLPIDHSWEPPLVEAEAQVHHVDLGAESSKELFLDSGKAYNTQAEDLLLAALAKAMLTWTGKPMFRIGLEHHGRKLVDEGIDVSRTVGWFTTFFPVRIKLVQDDDPGGVIRSVKEQLRGVAGASLDYGQLRYSSDPELRRRVSSDEQAEDVLFNYLGRYRSAAASGPLRAIETLSSAARAPENRRSHLLEINCWREEGRLRMDWIYNTRAHDTSTIAGWAEDYLRELRSVVSHCLSKSAPGYTPSDFPEAGMSQAELDDFLEQL